ncbi:TIR-like protein FxsC [Streptomyces coeruleorubidus]|uniref:TIR-like protein FxsC n=1 Tax=Streptomyces coeruleorubidus TaxID=116188 RepID=UPI0036512AB8
MVFAEPPFGPGYLPWITASWIDREDEPDAPEPDAHQPVGILREELARLLGTGAAPDAEDALDVLWIARLAGLDPVDWSRLGDGSDPTAAPPPAESPPQVVPDDHSTPDTTPEPLSARLHLPGPGTGAPAHPGGAHTIRVTQPKALPHTLALTRALRPMRQRVASPRTRTLDVDATAAASGDTGLLLPVLRPATERRFAVDLLIDTGATMTVWHRLADELRVLLARHGAFADVRAWALRTDGPEPTLAPFRRGGQAATPTRRWWQTLTDPSGRRAVLVLTDGVGPSWYGTELPAALAAWSRHRPVAALQVLPGRLWHRTALRTAPVRARATEAAHATLDVRSSGPLPGIARGSAGASDQARIRWLPVLEVSGDWLHPWARLVSGRTTDWVALRAAPLTVVERPAPVNSADEPTTPSAWIEHFEEGYSPDAFHLLRLLAAAPLSLPVMRLIQRTMLPASTPMHLAELFLSGVLVRRTPAEAGEDPDNVVYDFRPGVRDALLDRLTRTESLRVLDEVIDAVSERVTETFGGVTDFAALMTAVGEGGGLDGVELPENSRAFAEVAIAVIGGAGGDYERVAAKVARAGAAPGAEPVLAGVVPEEGGKRGRRSWVFPWRRERGETRVEAGGAYESFQGGARVPSGMPPLPADYVRRRPVRDVLVQMMSSAASGGAARTTTYLIVGDPGVGKTLLALDCAQELEERFTMIRWIDAGSHEALLRGLTDFAAELGISRGREAVVLARLRTYLREHPGWLLIYDDVPPDEVSTVWLPPEDCGGLLMTLSQQGHWSSRPYGVVTLGEFSEPEAVEYVRSALAPYRGTLWKQTSELAALVEVVGTHPRQLADAVESIRSGGRSLASLLRKVLAARPEVARFLPSLVWVTHNDEFVGTGVAVGNDRVLSADVADHADKVHLQDGSSADVQVIVRREDLPGLCVLMLSEPLLPPASPGPEQNAIAFAAWYERPAYDVSTPELRLSPGTLEVESLPAGTALVAEDGRLHSLLSTSSEGLVATRVTPRLITRFREHGVLRSRDREPEPMPSGGSSNEPLFYLSYARTPFASNVPFSPEHRFYMDLTGQLQRLIPLSARNIGFFDETRVTAGTRWQEPMRRALAVARVFVPLYSPSYFRSTWCGMEWDAFGRRQRREGDIRHSPVAAIVPVLWSPVDPLRMPRVAQAIQLHRPRLVRRYTQEGLLGLMEGNRSQYESAVRWIAEAIVDVAQASPLSHGDDTLFDDLRNAFDEY